jgi:intein/homing endonuclease
LGKIINYKELYEQNKFFPDKNNKIKDVVLDSSFAKFLGLFLADGNCYKPNKTSYRISIAFNRNQIELINEMKNYFIKLGLKFCERFQNNNGYTLTTYNKTLFELMIKCYDTETKEKILPDFAYYLGEDLKFVLEYWLKGDGWKSIRKSKTPCVMGCSTSFQLALSMRDISLSIGKIAIISRNKRKRYGVVCKDQYWVRIYDKESINFSLKRLSNFEYSSFIDKIEKYNYNGITYNLEVEDDNSYIANGIVVHNCVMSLVTLSNIFSHVHFKNMIDHMMENNIIPIDVKNTIEKYAYNKVDPEAPNYKSTSNNYSKVYGQKKYKPIQSSPWSNSASKSPWSK